MAKHVHIHVGGQPARQTRDSDEGGVWRTINGAHVFIKDGKITKGPAALVGKSEGEASRHSPGPGHVKAGAVGNEHEEIKVIRSDSEAEAHGSKKKKDGDEHHAALERVYKAQRKYMGAKNEAGRAKHRPEHEAATQAYEKEYGKLDPRDLNRFDSIVGRQGDVYAKGGTPDHPALKKPGKTELRKNAAAEFDRAKRGDGGSFHSAAEMYEQAGDAEKAAAARALAKRYGHDPESVQQRQERDKRNAAESRRLAQNANGRMKDLLLDEAAFHERLSTEPGSGNAETAKKLRAIQDAIADEISSTR
jgi:hypothetical protein